MPKETYQIFLSSTSTDLKVYRDKVREFIERLQLTSIRMETFGARPNKPLETCRMQVKECDALVVIVGKRYGWVPANSEGGDDVKSITWWEVVWALEAGKPVYAFLCDLQQDMNLESEQNRLTGASTEQEYIEIGNAVRNLQKFRAFLESDTTREIFSSADDLAAKVTANLQEFFLKIIAEKVKAPGNNEQSVVLLGNGRKSLSGGRSPMHNYEQIYWQEQIRWLSANYLFQHHNTDNDIGIAIIAGRANTAHPALAEATGISQFDVRDEASSQAADDYTTALVALLVGSGGDSTYYRGMLPPGTKISVFQVLSDTYTATDSIVLRAIEAALVGGNKIICHTLGSMNSSEIYKAVFKRVAQLGAIMVCSAGNQSGKTPYYPAAYPHCIAVAAVQASNGLSGFSNYGEWITTAAPGENIPTAIADKGYHKGSGTTFACTITTGVIALMLKANKDLRFEQVKEILTTTGASVYNANNEKMSFRQIDALQAVQAAIKTGAAAGNNITGKTGIAKDKKASK